MKRQTALKALVLLLFFLSGISGLVYQIVWTRMLVLVFGNTMLAMSTVLSAFMGGLAAGSLVLGRYVDRRPRPLVRVYAWLEAGIGLFALAFPWFLAAVTPLYMTLYEVVEGNLPLLNLARFSVCFLLIGIPTFLMGGTLPVLIKRFAGDARGLGSQTGFLYGLNTAGAVTGTVACGYFLLKNLGMQKTTWVAVAINLGVALIAFLIAKADRRIQPGLAVADPHESRAEPSLARYSSTTRLMVFVGIGISGFCALAYEVFWSRMLNLFLHNNIYSFTAILATFLTGIALGSLLYSRFLSRLTNQLALFIGLEIGIGILAYATPFVFQLLHENLFGDFAEALTLAKTSVIMIGPTILMGIAVPLAVEICQRGVSREGTSIGNVYAVNTFGSILGAFAAGFVLVPAVGLHRGVILVASLNVIAGVLPLLSVVESRAARWGLSGGTLLALLVGYAAAPQSLFLDLFQRSKPTAEILHYQEGRVANVLVYDFVKSGYKDLHLNAVEEASSRLWHVQAFKMLGLLPVLVHDDPDDALMIAFGAGMSAGACARFVDSLDCVDLNPDIDGVAAAFTRENLDVINNPRLNRVVNDGRNALLLNPRKYSLIISDATNPKMFDSWTLYSQEFYKVVKQRLKPGGVFCQWFLIPLPGDAIPVVLNTFRSVFPHMSLWCVYGSSQCLMLGTPERLEIDLARLEQRLEPILEPSGLQDFGVDSAEKFLSFFLMGEDHLGEMLGGFNKVSTDDLPYAQFHIEQDLAGVEAAVDLVRYQESILPYISASESISRESSDLLSAYERLAARLNLGFLTGNHTFFMEAMEVARLAGIPADQNVKNALQFDMEKKRYFAERIERFPDDANAHNSLGYIYWREGELEQAKRNLDRAIALQPEFTAAHLNRAMVHSDEGKLDLAVAKLSEVRNLSPAKATLRTIERQLANIYQLRTLQYQPDSAELWMRLGRSYFAQGEVPRALAAMRRALKLGPDNAANQDFMDRVLESLDLLEETVAPQSQRAWIDRRVDLRGDREGAPEHPATCDQALQEWNSGGFDGSVQEGSLRRAARLYEESIAAKPDDVHAFVDAATLYEILGEFERASALWNRLQAVVPEFRAAAPQARRLELMSGLDGLNEDEAVSHLLEIGQLYRQVGDLERSVETLSQALEIDPERPEIWSNLAVSLEATGRLEEAEVASERAAGQDPN